MALKDRFKKFTNDNYEQLYKEPVQQQPLFSDLQSELKEALSEKIASIPVWHEYKTDTRRELISSFISSRLNSNGSFLSEDEKVKLINSCLGAALGFGVIDSLIMHDDVTSVFVNGTDGVFFELDGERRISDIKLDEKQLDGIRRNILAMKGLLQAAVPSVLNFRYNSFLISAVMPEYSSNGLILTVKRCSVSEISVHHALTTRFLTTEIFSFIINLLNSEKRILITGPVNSGKTFLTDLLLQNADKSGPICVFEDFMQLFSKNVNISKFELAYLKSQTDFNLLFSHVIGMSPEYLFFDVSSDMYLSQIIENIYSLNIPSVISLRTPSFDAVSAKLTAATEKIFRCTEKQAKIRAFSMFDYIIELSFADAKPVVKSVIEVKASKTTLAFNDIFRLSNGLYEKEQEEDDFPDLTEADIPLKKSKLSERLSQN